MTIAALWHAAIAAAQFPAISNFGPQDYDAGTQNWQTAESPAGYIFVANNIGLMLYSGASWDIVYMPNHTNVHAVIFNRATDRIYAGAFEEFGYFKNTPPLEHSRYISVSSLLPEAERRFKDIWKIAETDDGTVAFQASDRVFLYRTTRNTVATRHFDSRVTDITAVDSALYISTEEGIYISLADSLRRLPGSEAVSAHQVCGAYSDSTHTVVFGTRTGGLYRLADGAFAPLHIPALSEAMQGRQIFCMARSPRWIALGTIGHGMLAYDCDNARVHHLNRDNGLRNNTVLDIKIDSDQNMWAALDNGLSYVMFDSPFRTIFSDANTVGTGYASMPLADRLYIGTNQGLYHIPLPGDYTRSAFNPVEVRDVSGQIWTLTRAGDTLLCGANAGAFTVADGRATPIDGMGATWAFRPYPGRSDMMIASMYDGFAVLRLSDGRWRLHTRISGPEEGTVNFEIDADGRIWFSHWLQGVYSFRLSPDLTRAVDIEIYNAGNQLPTDDNNLVTAIDGHVYISAADGFHRRDTDTPTLHKVAWLDSLFPPSGISTRIFETPQGDLWAHRPDRLEYAARQGDTYTLRRYHYSSAVQRLQMNLGNLSYLPGGQTVMNHDDGFYIVEPRLPDIAAKEASIIYVRAAGTPSDSSSYLPHTVLHDEKLTLNMGERDLTFVYSMPEYRDVNAVLFSTHIDGYDDEWTPYTPQTERTIYKLTPGEYTFRLKAYDTFTGTTRETSLRFTVPARWYETWWARAILILLAVVAVYIAIETTKRWIMRLIERRRNAERARRERLQELQRLEDEKASVIRHNESLNQEIKRKSAQMADSDILIQRKSDVLKDVNERIERIIASGKDSPELLSELRDLRRSLIIHDKEEACWDRMEENFNIIFDDLLKKLMSRYPAITRNDIRLCSYLKLNMSTKEIATLMNVSERSVESNRYRLRKKLGMAPGQSFQEFFAGIS